MINKQILHGSHSVSNLTLLGQVLRPVGAFFLVTATILLLIGGVIFWTPQVASFFVVNNSLQNKDDLEVAQSGLKTIKRMVGNNEVWSVTIQQEYNQLFAETNSWSASAANISNYGLGEWEAAANNTYDYEDNFVAANTDNTN